MLHLKIPVKGGKDNEILRCGLPGAPVRFKAQEKMHKYHSRSEKPMEQILVR